MANATAPPTSDYGQLGPASAGQRIQAPWFEGSWPITQGWGPATYSGEPEGHGFAHWHAGVDVGLDCGTTISLPADFSNNYLAQSVYLDNPGGYGTALILQVSYWPSRQAGEPHGRAVDIYLGHLRTRLVPNGQTLSPGQPVAISNNTGNSTGCHVHFEVRPAGGRYGTDIDPAPWLLYGAASQAQGQAVTADQNPYNPITQPAQWAEWQAMHDIQAPLKAVGNELLGIAQAGLGSALMLGGLVLTGAGLRGMNAGQFVGAARRTFTRPAAGPTNLAPSQEAAAPAQVEEATDATTPMTEQRLKSRLREHGYDESLQTRQGGKPTGRLRPTVRTRTSAERMAARRSRVRQSHQGRAYPPMEGYSAPRRKPA